MAFGKLEVSKSAVAGGVTSMSELLRQRLEIAHLIDQLADELGVQFGELNKVNHAIGQKIYNAGNYGASPPAFLSEAFTAEVLRNRLAAELSEHSSGGGNESVLGPVVSRETLVSLFAKNHAGVVAGRE